VRFLHFPENDKRIRAKIFFKGLGENTCLLQPALNSTAPGRGAEKFGAAWFFRRRSCSRSHLFFL